MNTAAVFTRTRRLSADGYELMFATNHLGPFLLTSLLLGPLRAGSGRVLTITAPSTVAVVFDDLQRERGFRPLRAFGASKMANLLFAYELARRGGRFGVTSNAIHPGAPPEPAHRQAPAPLRWVTRLASRPPERAAAAIVPLAHRIAHARTTGQLLKEGRPVATNAFSHDPANQARLWGVSCALTGLTDTI